MGDILFLAHRIPFPPDRGDKIRSHHLLKALAKRAPVHVGCFAESACDFAHERALGEAVASHCVFRRSTNLALTGTRALATGRPVSLVAFEDARLHAWVQKTLRDQKIETIFVFSGQMGQYVPANFSGRLLVDLCDVDSAKFEAYTASERRPRRWIYEREGRLLAIEETRLAERADFTFLVSDAEADLFRSRCSAARQIETLGNGIDVELFDPKAVAPDPAMAASPGPHLVFTGQMDYPPNVVATVRMANRILPRVRKLHPQTEFHVVGRAPTPEVRRLDGIEGVRVWGEVPDVRPFLAGADLVVAPLTIARGVQNKILEAMAMARPVVLSAEAASGIDALDNEHFAIAADDAAFIERILALLGDGPGTLAMAAAGRRFVVERKGWNEMLAPLDRIVGSASNVSERDAA